MQELGEQNLEKFPLSPLRGVCGPFLSTFGWEVLGGCEVEESVTQFFQ